MGIFSKDKVNIKTVADILEKEVFQLGTVNEEGKPRVRPLGACSLINNRICICTNSTKDMSKQMKNNPDIQISCLLGEGPEWIRVSAKARLYDDEEVKKTMISSSEYLESLYEDRMDIFEVFYLEDPKIFYYKENGEVEEIK